MSTPDPSDAVDLLAELDALGIQLEADGERMRFRPREAVTVDLAARLRRQKAELLAEVRRRDAVTQRIRDQLARLVPYRTPDGRQGWVDPRCRDELERLGF